MINDLKEKIINGGLDNIFAQLYCGAEFIEKQRERYIGALDSFKNIYGDGEVEVYSAPGRTEVGGNHTDHQNGRVLTASINLDAIAVCAKREGTIIRITSEGYGEISVDISNLDVVPEEKESTAAIIRGTVAAMNNRGYNVGSFDAYVTSDVLSGSGLSSSAAFEVLIANIISGMYNNSGVDPIVIAQIGKEAENKYFGKPSGLLDQMASSVGGLINIDFKDPKNPVVKKVDVDFNKYNHSLCIVDTKGSHADLTDEYAAVTVEMKKVSQFFGVNYLSEVDKDEFYKNLAEIRKVTGDRAVMRAMHWFSENIRVDGQVAALTADDFEQFKKLIKTSGDSSYKYLQNVYSAKNVEEQNVSVALALSDEILGDKGVSRVHGGGFAGTIAAFVPNDMVAIYKNKMEAVFGDDACYILKIRPVGGTRIA